MDNQESYQSARKRVEAEIGFSIHFEVYIAVNILLFVINISTSPEYFWCKWPLLGWGIGVFFHALGVFFFSRGFTLKERKIEREMHKQKDRKRG